MAEEKTKNQEENSTEVKKLEDKLEEKKEDQKKVEEKLEQKKDPATEEKKNIKKTNLPPTIKKEKAISKGVSVPASMKQCAYICSFIKNKHIDKAISDLEEVIKMKKIVPFKGEIPHRHGKRMMSGRYPIKASKIFIKLLKGLKGNVIVNGLDMEKTRIVLGSANWASRPMRSNNRRGKRTNILLEAKEIGVKK